MDKLNLHIVHNINATVNCNSDTLREVNNGHIGDLIKAAIEELSIEFDQVGKDGKISFSEISIDVDVFDGQLFSLKDKIKETIRKEVLNARNEVDSQVKTSTVRKAKTLSPLDTLLHFLKSGSLPWNSKIVALCIDDYEKNDLDEKFIRPLQKVLYHNPQAISRLVNQFPEKEISKLMELLISKEFASSVFKLKKEILVASNKYSKIYDLGFRLGNLLLEEIFKLKVTQAKYNSKKKTSFSNKNNWKSIVVNLVHKSINRYPDLDLILFEEAILETNDSMLISCLEEIREIKTDLDYPSLNTNKKREAEVDGIRDEEVEIQRDAIFSKTDSATFSEESDVSKISKFQDTQASIHVFNAGIILLHSFLPAFFEKVGLIETGQFISKASQQRAVCLLHYIATGELQFEEQYLYFQKYICNYSHDDSIPKNLPISPFEKDEVDKLLNAVLTHWKSLKGATPNGLRGNYLVRQGVLQNAGSEPVIHIEHKTADILLKQIPWTLSIAKWPWHSKLLTIKWS